MTLLIRDLRLISSVLSRLFGVGGVGAGWELSMGFSGGTNDNYDDHDRTPQEPASVSPETLWKKLNRKI